MGGNSRGDWVEAQRRCGEGQQGGWQVAEIADGQRGADKLKWAQSELARSTRDQLSKYADL